MEKLNLNVLLLNKFYSPIGVVSVKDAFIKLSKGRAEVVHVEDGYYKGYDFNTWAELSALKQELGIESDEDYISTSSLELALPKVIRTLEYAEFKDEKAVGNPTRKTILYRDKKTCQYCGKVFPSSGLNRDHVIPRSRGGENTWENLVASCFKCNTKKDNRTPKEAGMKLLSTPVKPKFIPNNDFVIKDKRYITWKHFVSEIYWNVELG